MKTNNLIRHLISIAILILMLSFKLNSSILNKIYKYNFYYKSANGSQFVSYNVITEKKIEFRIITIIANEKKEIIGNAVYKKNGDGETILDNTGDGYFVDEYIYTSKNCTLTIRIDNEEHQVCQVLSKNCDKSLKIAIFNVVMQKLRS